MTAERDHRELHAEQKRDVPLSLLADEGRATHRGTYRVRPAVPFVRSAAGWRNSPSAAREVRF